jgi:hypothetical protein
VVRQLHSVLLQEQGHPVGGGGDVRCQVSGSPAGVVVVVVVVLGWAGVQTLRSRNLTKGLLTYDMLWSRYGCMQQTPSASIGKDAQLLPPPPNTHRHTPGAPLEVLAAVLRHSVLMAAHVGLPHVLGGVLPGLGLHAHLVRHKEGGVEAHAELRSRDGMSAAERVQGQPAAAAFAAAAHMHNNW